MSERLPPKRCFFCDCRGKMHVVYAYTLEACDAVHELQRKVSTLRTERDDAREAASWWRAAAQGYALKKTETHPDERWPWLNVEVSREANE